MELGGVPFILAFSSAFHFSDDTSLGPWKIRVFESLVIVREYITMAGGVFHNSLERVVFPWGFRLVGPDTNFPAFRYGFRAARPSAPHFHGKLNSQWHK